LSGKDLASKPYSHLDNPDFGGHAKRQEASFTTPNSMPSRTASACSSTPKHLAQTNSRNTDDSRPRTDAVHTLPARHAREQIKYRSEIDYLPGLASDEKNSEAVGCKIFIYMAHF
jgi:hypothetical protein